MRGHQYYTERQTFEDHKRALVAQIGPEEIPKSHGYRQENRVHFHECPSPWCQRARRKHYKEGCKLDKIAKCYPCKSREKRRAGAA